MAAAMSTRRRRGQFEPRIQAEALADALASQGFTTTVYKAGGHQTHPCIQVSWGAGRYRTEYIYTAPDGGPWRFWWSSLVPIAPLSEISQAAETIAGALTAGGGAVPEEVIWL
jgi:hypothetical protein